MLAFESKILGPKSVNLGKKTQPSFIGSWMIEDISVCDGLLQEFEGSKETYEGQTLVDKKSQVSKFHKDSIDLLGSPYRPAFQKYAVELQKCLLLYLQQYERSGCVEAFNVKIMVIQKYPKGGAYHQWHTERMGIGTPARHLVFMTYLNDVEDGGETEFMYQKFKVKPRKGLTLIWPVDWTHTHRGIPSMTEEKSIVTGWYEFTEHMENGN